MDSFHRGRMPALKEQLMDRTGSITAWVREVERGDEEAARRLWEVFFPRVIGVVRRHLDRATAGMEEDVALDALFSFFRGAQDRRFPGLRRDDLWALLVVIA